MEILKSVSDTALNDAIKADKSLKVYKRRWIILLLFALCSGCNSSHWIQYSIITNIIVKYYGISRLIVDWTSIVYMALYIPLVFPASWLLQKKGLRMAVILGAILLAIGSWIKVFSTKPDGFPIALVGQTIIGISQMFTLGIPARLAAVWFPYYQISTATALGVFGNQIGIAVGFVLPPLIVHEGGNIGNELYYLHLGTAMAATIIFICIYFFFEASPKSPPSKAQEKLLTEKSNDRNKHKFSSSLKRLFQNLDFVLLLISFALNIGAFYAYSTLLNQLIISHFPNATEDAGAIGLILIIGGILGAISWGIILDKTHKYKETTIIIYLLAVVGMAGFTLSLEKEVMSLTYVSSIFLGFFMNGYLTVGYEFGAELTYPESEATSSGLLNAGGELCGVISVLVAGVVLDKYGAFVTNLLLVALLVFGFLLCIFVNGKRLHRLAATRQPVSILSVS